MNSVTNNYSEDELFLLIRQGSEAAYTVLYDRFLDLLFLKAFSILDDTDEAKDVAQEVLIWLWDHHASVQINTGVKAYLIGAVKQRCADVIRKKANRDNRQQMYASLSASITGTSPLETKELGHQLQAAMALVSPTSRKVFIMSYIEKKQMKEIAAALNIKVQTAKNHMQQALKILRQHLPKN
ncbi:sigma-70 family RNA polymerase sigma factor [Chitinophaga filiformis]|uniref:sigma-70 family RNA polymerase sigma factor n=1 Tax=Chitinophaga filiformis TaxID=104663 RepID=UPI001F255CF7|nr:sigma-70 family RNA polymerase sigma factor [Chitinophaga filiformis]MCF6401255.1 sigma-70 family RNA polymerase sigma factor [Chitinophaga filiformis]